MKVRVEILAADATIPAPQLEFFANLDGQGEIDDDAHSVELTASSATKWTGAFIAPDKASLAGKWLCVNAALGTGGSWSLTLFDGDATKGLFDDKLTLTLPAQKKYIQIKF